MSILDSVLILLYLVLGTSAIVLLGSWVLNWFKPRK
jgi:hypothetical protein